MIAKAHFLLCLPLAVAACGTFGNADEEGVPSAAQMRSALEGRWAGTVTGAPDSIELSMEYVPPGRLPLCGTRTVSHPLCITTTASHVKATIASTDARLEGQTGTGTFETNGLWNEKTGTYGSLGVTFEAVPWQLEGEVRDRNMTATLRDTSSGSRDDSTIVAQFELTRTP